MRGGGKEKDDSWQAQPFTKLAQTTKHVCFPDSLAQVGGIKQDMWGGKA